MRYVTFALLLIALPALSFAAGLVPECGLGAGQFMCQACHLAALAHNILLLFVTLAAFAATLMFVYAGFLYVTAAANQSNIDSAKRVFGQTLIGLIFVLVAWIIVDMAMRVFTDQSLAVWTSFSCVRGVSVGGTIQFPESSIDAVVPEQTQQVIPGERLTHDEARQLLEQCGYTVTSTGSTPRVSAVCQTSGCTSVQGLRADTVTAACAAARACAASNTDCARNLLITGGTECFAHGRGSSITHCNGYKVDIEDTTAFRAFINNPNNGFFTRVPPGQPTRSGFPEWRDRCGNSIIDEGNHFDYQVTVPCPG